MEVNRAWENTIHIKNKKAKKGEKHRQRFANTV